MTSGHVWKKAPKGMLCTYRVCWCDRAAVVFCECALIGWSHARCSRHKPRKRVGK
jgi:hypothetical protein